MPSEPLPWDRKDFLKERKHERSDPLGSVARWRDSSHHGSREFSRWGSADFRRPTGHGKQGGWHLLSEESGHGYARSPSCDKMLEEDNCRPLVSRGDGKHGRSSRENRGSFSQRDWREPSWDATNSSLNLSRRQSDGNNDQRSVDDLRTYSSYIHCNIVNPWEHHQLKDQHDKMGGVNGLGLGTGQRCDRENSLSSIDWKPLKWTRSGSLSLRGSGISHSNSSRSNEGADSFEVKAELQPKNAAAIESRSGEAAACVTSSAPSDDTDSRKKKPRLNWGEGLAKYEKKKIEGPDFSANKDGPILSASNMEPCNFLSPSLVDKSPKVTGFSDCASPATPSSVACSSSPGVDDKLFGKAANVDNDVSNLSGSPGPCSQSHLQGLSLNFEKLDIDSFTNSGSSLIELLQSDDLSSVESSLVRSSTMNKLLIWKADISKVLEVTETEIDLLENELKSLKSVSGDRFQCQAAFGSLLVYDNAKSCEEPVGGPDKVSRPEPLQIVSSDDHNVEKMPLSTNLHNIPDNGKEEDIDSPGTATSKFVEPPPLIKAVSSCDVGRSENCSGDLDAMKCLAPCTSRKDASVTTCGDGSPSTEVNDGMDATSGASLCCSTEDILYNTIISSNKESANRSCEVFSKLLPNDCCKIGNIGATSGSCSHNGALIIEKFAEKKRFVRFKERVLTLKFKALHHLWKEDMRLLSIRKCRPRSHKKFEVGVRTASSGHQKNRSSIRSRFPFPAGNHLSLVPTSEIINFTSKMLSESQVKVHRNTLKMPALILDDKEKVISKFISCNGLVKDPLAIEKERAMINPWTSEEREVFLEKFAAFGKDFRKIASFVEHKTTADCVEFYYKNHKSDCFQKIKKQNVGKLAESFSAKTDLMVSGRKWNRGVNAASLEILSAASVMADGIASHQKMHSGGFLLGQYGNMKTSRGEDSIIERSSSFDVLRDDRETVAADVLAGICGSLSSEAVSSCITSSVDPVEGKRDRKCLKVNPLCKQPVTPDVSQNVDDETCSDESSGEMDPTDWTDEEKATFLQAVSSFGKDFAMIARCVGTRSKDQCKVFFSKARKCLGLDLMRPRPENVGSPVNDGGGSDTDDACVVATGSVIGTDKSGTGTEEDLPLSVMNTYRDESNPVEAGNLSADLNESKEIHGGEVDHEDVNMVSAACEIKGGSKLGFDGSGVVSDGSDKSASIRGQTKGGKDQVSRVGGAVTELVSASDITEPSHSNSIAEDRLVSEVSSGDLGNELEGRRALSPRCLDDRDDKHEADTGVVVELKSSVHDLSTVGNTSLLSVDVSCSRFSFDAENQPLLSIGKPISALSLEDPHATADSLLQNTLAATVQCEKTASQDQLSSTCDFQGSRDMHCQNSIHSVKKEAHGVMCCSSSATEFPLLSDKIEQDDHCRTQLRHSSDPEKTSRNGDVKLFGKILTNPSSTQKPNLTKGGEENGTHHPEFSSISSSMKGHHNADGNSALSNFDQNDYRDLENVPIGSYDYWNGNRIQSGFSSLPDSAILLAKYSAAFGNYPTSSVKSEQQSLQALAKNNEQHLNGASSVLTTREANGSNGVTDCQVFRNGDGLKVQPFMVGVKHQQDVFLDIQRRNGFEAVSSLQQEGRGMVGMNGVGRRGILVGGSDSGVSDPVAAIKMHYSNSDRYGGQTGSIMREDESWGGKGDLGR